jgi:hypothetical protein
MATVCVKPIALEGLDALREQRLQVHPDHLVSEDAWVGVAAEQRHRLALGVALACEVGPLDQQLDLWWRPAIMHIAVGSGPMTSAGADGGPKICAMAPPLSLLTRSTLSMPSASRTSRSIFARAVNETSCVGEISE